MRQEIRGRDVSGSPLPPATRKVAAIPRIKRRKEA